MSHHRSAARRARPVFDSLEGRALLTGGFTEFSLPAPAASQFVQVHDIVATNDDQIAFATARYGPADAQTGQPTYLGTGIFNAQSSSAAVSAVHPEGDSTRSSIYGLVQGPDGNLWGIVNYAPARLNADGTITRFALATGSLAQAITPGPDGALYFTEPYRGLTANAAAGSIKSAIGRITTDGKITEAILPDNEARPDQITVGPDKALWFTLNDFGAGNAAPSIGRITTIGSITEYAVPNTTVLPHSITAGPDGNLWFTAQGIAKGSTPTVNTGSNFIGKVTTAGAITLFPLPAQVENQKAGFVLGGITAGPDGNVWFAEPKSGHIASITPTGQIAEFAVPTSDSAPTDIALGRDGALWFTELLGNKVGRYLPGPDLAATVTLTGAVASMTYSGAVASVVDRTPGAITSYAAMIDWGDGSTPTQGSLVRNGSTYNLVGTHTYNSPGTYRVGVAAREISGEGTTAVGAVVIRTGQAMVAKSDQPRRKPLRLALSYDGPIDGSVAANVSRYKVEILGPRNRRGVRSVKQIRLKAASYDPNTKTVYLTPRGAIGRKQATRVTISGEGTLSVG